MNERIREQLLGYILDALDDDELVEVRRQLQNDPIWQRELEVVRKSLEPLEECFPGNEDPPPRLADRTCSLAAAHSDAITSASQGLPAAMRSDSLSRPTRWGDFVVAAGIFMAAALLFFPAISNSRQLARRTHCSENLRRVGFAVAQYCDYAGGGYFPYVPTTGNRAFAGVYGPILFDGEYLLDAQTLICPASPLAFSAVQFRVPTIAEIDQATDVQLIALRHTAGGSYGYNLGYIENGVHCGPKNRGRANFALMSDAPQLTYAGYGSSHHGGRGQNVLFEDGHVQFVTAGDSDTCLDNPFRNHRGAVEAGVDRNDAVIAPSFAPPFIQSARTLDIPQD